MKGGNGFGVVDIDGRWSHLVVVMAKPLAVQSGRVAGISIAFRCSQGLPEYLSEESEEDDIMIAPRCY